METTAFVFDDVNVTPDKQIEMHSHSQWELSYVSRGKGVRIIGDTSEAITEGEMILIPPNIPHVWRFNRTETGNDGMISNISIFFETQTLERLQTVVPEISIVSQKIRSLTGAVRYSGAARDELSRLILSMRFIAADARLPKMFEMLVILAYAEEYETIGHSIILSQADLRMEKVRVYCRCNYARAIKLDDVAAHVGMNKSSFCTFMRHHTGKSLTEFVNDIRLSKAKELLSNTDYPIASIAYETGFSNVTYFNRLFRRRYNRTPKSERRAGS